MFTVKHRAADGVEILYSAETVEVVQMMGRFVDGIYLDWPAPPPTAPNDPVAAARPPAKHVIAITSPYVDDAAGKTHTPQAAEYPRATWEPKVWVMNEAGATVASYDL